MGNTSTHNIEDIKKHIIISIREVTKNRRDRWHDYRKTSRPFMRKMQTRRILRIYSEYTSANGVQTLTIGFKLTIKDRKTATIK